MTFTKADMVSRISNKAGLSKTKSTAVVESLLETIKQTLESGEDVLVSGFGKFCVKGKNSRRGRNPATGNDLMLDARRVVTFKCSSVLQRKLNGV
jgi:integration host factor subunit alpha